MVAPQPKSPAVLTRRSALTLAVFGVPSVLGVAAVAGCGIADRSGEPEARTLTTLIGQARADAAIASALAPTVPDRGAALALVASQRTAHADALTGELSRFLDRPAPSAVRSAPPAPPGTLAQLRAALTVSARDAGTAAVAASGAAASLIGAVSAATSAHATVVLA